MEKWRTSMEYGSIHMVLNGQLLNFINANKGTLPYFQT